MKKASIIFLSATLLASPLFALGDAIVATYKGGEVKESQVMQQFQAILSSQPGGKDKKFSDLDPKLQETLVRAYINVQLLGKEAKDSDVATSKEAQIKFEALKNQVIQQEFMENYVKSRITDAMVTKAYDELVNNLKGKKEFKVSHILVKSEKEAIAIKNRLNKGEKFDKLAKELSIDEGSKVKGGEIGYITSGQLVPAFEEKALSMKINEISAPVQTEFGWHVITVLDIRDIKVPSIQEATPGIKEALGREIIEKHLADIAKQADVKIMLPKVADDSKKEPVDK
jgi:parvulin-like peptidyl-prolyl isomerase